MIIMICRRKWDMKFAGNWDDGKGSAVWTGGRRGTRPSLRKKAQGEKRRIG